eukprot:4909584-Pleurochrysis_carterae.AAC.1
MQGKDAVAKYLQFESRPAASQLAAFGCTKGVVWREGGVKVVCSTIPPLIVEVCHRSHGRTVLSVTCNLLTFNDHNALYLPPLFEYAKGERASFRRMVLEHLEGMANNDVKLSRRMRSLLPPSSRDGEDEWEEAEESDEVDEGMESEGNESDVAIAATSGERTA